MTVFNKTYSAEIDIHTNKESVWETLVDLENYKTWNPFTLQVETDWQLGGKVFLLVQMTENKKPIKQVEYLSKLVQYKEIAWGLDWGPWLKAERVQRIVPIREGHVRYKTQDSIKGILCPLVHLLYGAAIQRGFENLAISLKKRLEKA